MRLRLLFAIAISVSLLPSHASAKQYHRQMHGREVVVHTNPIPVVLHRMVPPQHGRHMTEREIQQGKLPQAGRYGRVGN